MKKGDTVRLKTGKSPQIVRRVEIRGETKMLRCEYLSSVGYNSLYVGSEATLRRWRRASDYVLIQTNEETKPEEAIPMTDLYQTKEPTPRFGIKIAVNSAGHIVLEMKGEGGKVEAFPNDTIELVLPYTVSLSVVSLGHKNAGHETTIHVVAEKGQVEKDQLLLELNSGTLWRVTDLDSRVKTPRANRSKWLRIPSEHLTLGEDK